MLKRSVVLLSGEGGDEVSVARLVAVWQAMEQLVQQGKISYVGSSNFAGWDIATAQALAGARHFAGLTSEQSLYNLAVRAIEQEVIPALRHLGIGLIAYSPLHAGMLTGILTNANSTPAEDPRIEGLRDQLTSYEALCAELGATPTQVALAWVLSNPATSAAISVRQTSTSSTLTSPPSTPTSNQRRCKPSTRSSPDPGKLHSPTPGNAPATGPTSRNHGRPGSHFGGVDSRR